ncbi:MAG: hypothetical protein GY702_18320, partial [Desulfobulbaceae bacterium]|nr:hypothetical protein [Desulfobulbaceae bacterium]
PVISHVVNKYLECGDLHQGFARIKCPHCQHEYILSLACRWLVVGLLWPLVLSKLS